MPEESLRELQEAHLRRMPKELRETLFALPPSLRAAVLAAVEAYHRTMEVATYRLVVGLAKAYSVKSEGPVEE